MGIIYQPTKFQLNRLINNVDLLADRSRWKHIHTHTYTHTHTHTHTQTESDTLLI